MSDSDELRSFEFFFLFFIQNSFIINIMEFAHLISLMDLMKIFISFFNLYVSFYLKRERY